MNIDKGETKCVYTFDDDIEGILTFKNETD